MQVSNHEESSSSYWVRESFLGRRCRLKAWEEIPKKTLAFFSLLESC
jgi:hypothetical protein